MNTDWIKNGARCADKRGKKYTIITCARDVQIGDTIVVYVQDFGEKDTLCCPIDAFIVSFVPCSSSDEIIPLATRVRPKNGQERMMQFFDTDDFQEKVNILKDLHIFGELTNSIIDNLAATLDVVIEEGDIETRYDQLRLCVETRARFENSRLRKQA